MTSNIYYNYLGPIFVYIFATGSNKTEETLCWDSIPYYCDQTYTKMDNSLPTQTYRILTEDERNFQEIVSFGNKLINESVDIDPEYVDIVNEYFWDLI